jgi:SAM-dependent methyltransferase
MKLATLKWLFTGQVDRPVHYDPAVYWENRAANLIETYDRPETWPKRQWMREGAEEEAVPRLLRDHDCQSVLVLGAGPGRQYAYLDGFDVYGLDISPTLVAACQARYPNIPTVVGEVVGCEAIFDTCDAVLSSAVLGHIPPADIEAGVASTKAAARRLIILREYTSPFAGTYQWGRGYDDLMRPWRVVHRETTDERDGEFAVELIAYVPEGA